MAAVGRTRRFAVVGHPVAHSLSPRIHAAFARETGIAVDYGTLLAPLDGFADAVRRFAADGGAGVNVTVPFKREAHALCGARVTERARRAGAVNCIALDGDPPRGDNTDGVGLMADLARLVGGIADARVLLVGAGGAASGVVGPLLDARPAALVVANRDPAKAAALVARFAPSGGTSLAAASFDHPRNVGLDIVINATSASVGGGRLALPPRTLAGVRLAYDMMYGATPTPFLVDASNAGARAVADGLGMLVEQAAESFAIWHGVRPATAPVLALLREHLAAAR